MNNLKLPTIIIKVEESKIIFLTLLKEFVSENKKRKNHMAINVNNRKANLLRFNSSGTTESILNIGIR
jgi:hypothetical protein